MRQVRPQREAGFTLIELLIVILMVGILAAAGIPLYMGYTRDAKAAEGKAVVSSYWTAWRSAAMQNCGIDTPLTAALSKAGLTAGGATIPARWTVASVATTLNAACADGALTQSAALVTTGTAADVSTINIRQSYLSTDVPPMQLRCTTDGTTPTATSPLC